MTVYLIAYHLTSLAVLFAVMGSYKATSMIVQFEQVLQWMHLHVNVELKIFFCLFFFYFLMFVVWILGLYQHVMKSDNIFL